MTQIQKIGSSLLVLIAAIVTLLNVFEVVSWSAEQSTGVSVTAGLGVTFALAVYAHFKPGTSTEPVLLLGSFTAFLGSLLGLLVLFGVLELTPDEIAQVIAGVVAFVAFGGSVFVRSQVDAPVTPPT